MMLCDVTLCDVVLICCRVVRESRRKRGAIASVMDLLSLSYRLKVTAYRYVIALQSL
jgi:hypothetical protein